jgi:copper chaperone
MHYLYVPGMNCGGCLSAITRAIRALDPGSKVQGNLETRRIEIISDEAEASLLEALSSAGYPAQSLSEQV